LPNVGPYIYDVSISGFTRSSIYIYDISSLRVNCDGSLSYLLYSLSYLFVRLLIHLFYNWAWGSVVVKALRY